MAEILSTECIQKTKVIHRIICDKCGVHICDSEEYDDGYYEDPSEYAQTIHIPGYCCVYKAQLCDKCQIKTTEELVKMLTNFGFTIRNQEIIRAGE